VSGPLSLEDIPDTIEAVVPDPSPTVKPFRAGTSFSWLVQMRDGRVLRVDAASASTGNGILVFSDMLGGLIAAFEYGDWKRVSIMDRATGELDGWAVVKERKK
jgi:hypothetical protein